MKLKQWLEAERGRAKALAEHLECSKSMVSQMASGDVRVPPAYYRSIRDFTGGEVALEDLLPADHGHAHQQQIISEPGKPIVKLSEAPSAAERRAPGSDRRTHESLLVIEPDHRRSQRREVDLLRASKEDIA